MIKHLEYLRYISKHKWYVMVECWKHGLIWRGFIHDWSKFLPSEWFPYVEYFHGKSGVQHKEENRGKSYQCGSNLEFDRAWLRHIHRNKHHWQHYILIQDEDEDKALPIPRKYLIEMLCDWKGAGRAQGKPDTIAWYEKNKGKMIMADTSRQTLENILHEKATKAKEASVV